MKEKAGRRPKEKALAANGRSLWLVLFVIAMAVSIIVMDLTIVDVSMPAIMTDLHLGFASVEWVVDLYSLVFASLLITFGRIADHIGRKKMMIIGLAVFLAGSIVAAVAPSLAPLLVGRFIQGVGGAMILPTTLSSINTIFKGKYRIVAFATYGSSIAVAAGIAPLIGGLFTTYSTWRWVFWFDVIVAAVVGLLVWYAVPDSLGEKIKGMFDFGGFVLSTLGFVFVVYGLIEGQNYGWWHPKAGTRPWAAGLSRIPWVFLAGIVALVLFVILEVILEDRGKSTLMSVKLFKYRSFSFGNIVSVANAVGEYGLVFLLPLYLQNILNLSAIETGYVLCVMASGAFISGGFATPFVKYTSAKAVISTGFLFEAGSMAGFYFTIRPGHGAIEGLIYLWLALYGVGLGFASAQLTSVIMIDVPDVKAGQGSSVKSTISQLSSALAIAVIGIIFVDFLWATLPPKVDELHLPDQFSKEIDSVVIGSSGSAIPELEGSREYQSAPASFQKEFKTKINSGFTEGISNTLGVDSLILLGGGIVSWILPNEKKRRKAAKEGEAAKVVKAEADTALDL
ncbi:MAG: MFS transporter [Aeriscardovia sp.]|nr:MFS transporter [Aeriscardovia sp.]MBQ5556979.1 MFS transporter [Aeriscardovia sp.]